MPRTQRNTFSPVTTRADASRNGRAVADVVSLHDAPPGAMDADAVRALAWLKRGKPRAEIAHDDAVPSQTPADLKLFRKASYRREKA